MLEATGVYYLDLACALYKAGLAVTVINPKSFHHFARLKLEVSKTDRLDAALLAEYAKRISPALWTPPDVRRLELRDIGRQINRLTHARAQAKNRLHALTSKRATPRLLINDKRGGIRALDRRIVRLSEAAERLIARGKKKMQALCAVMRKYLTGLWACLKAGEAFDSSKLFSSRHMTEGA